mgnify:CR=1 FL=1|jgi:hypothetical protein
MRDLKFEEGPLEATTDCFFFFVSFFSYVVSAVESFVLSS